MYKLLTRWASVALAAAVACIIVPAAYAYGPSIVSSFRMSGVTAPYARGIFTLQYPSTIYGIFYEGPGRHSLRAFTSTGSLIATYSMPGGVMLGDADFLPEGSPGYMAVVDEGSHELKAYGSTGSFYGVIRTLPSDVVAYARGGHVTWFTYLGTNGGIVYRYTPTWGFLNSFATGVPIGDLAAGRGYDHRWGNWVILGPSRPPAALRAYRESGYFYGTFALPGNASRGAVYGGGNRSTMCCLRDLGNEMWAYVIDTGGLMPVEPASLGRIKALYK